MYQLSTPETPDFQPELRSICVACSFRTCECEKTLCWQDLGRLLAASPRHAAAHGMGAFEA